MYMGRVVHEGVALSNAEKLAWLREHVNEGAALPDIYHQEHFRPNGMGPETWHGWLLNVVMMILNHPFALPEVEEIGDLHDWRFYCGGTQADFMAANLELYVLMLAKAPFVWWNPWTWQEFMRMKQLAEAYYKCVVDFGSVYFNYRNSGD